MTADGDAIVVIRRRLAATRDEVFAAWLDPEGIVAWMCPGPVVSAEAQLDPRVGGEIRILMRTATEAIEHRGEFVIVDPPSKLAFTWRAKATDFVPTLVTLELSETADGHCDLALTHERIPRSDVRDQYRGGWGLIVARLEAFLQARREAS